MNDWLVAGIVAIVCTICLIGYYYVCEVLEK